MTPDAKLILEQISEDQQRDFQAHLKNSITLFFKENGLPEEWASKIQFDINQWYKEDI